MMFGSFLSARVFTFARNVRFLAFLLICFAPRVAWGILLVATDGNNLSRFDSGSLGTVTPVPVTGMQSGETLVGIDYRPATGQLYGVGSTSRMYTLNPFTGAAVQVGSAGAFSLTGTAFGTDFNPVPDRLRQVSNTEQNLRLNPNDGTLTMTDANLNPAGNVVAVAYSNNFAGATATTLYAIDSAAGTLGNITAPNSGGPITTVGSLGLGTNLNPNIGFDIVHGIAYATITTGSPGVSRLYTINLGTGAATLVGQIGSGTTPFLGLTAILASPLVNFYAINSANNNLVRFSNQNLGSFTSTAVTGLIGGDTIIALDFRPATGQLYGLGTGSRLYIINPATGAATQVGTDGQFALPPGVAFGFDFNPVVDRIRVTSDFEQNFRLDPTNGQRPGGTNDTALAYASGDPNFGLNADVGGAAYTNNFFGATTTTLFDIDTAQNVLVRQGGINVPPGTPSPNTGQLFTIGPLGINPTDDATRANTGFDIQTLSDGTNIAYAALTTNGTSSQLYSVNLTSGGATSLGPIGGAAPTLIRALAIAPAGAFEFSAPAYSVGESGPVATITINRLRGSDGSVSVFFTTTNGTADASDYTDSDQTVTFGNGVTSQTVTIPLNNDSLDEANETINLALSNPTGSATLGAQSTAVLTITDDDVFGINLVKRTNGTDNNTAPGPTVPVGSTVTFSYIVTNTGNVPLAGVTVVDDNGTAGNPADDFSATFAGGDSNGNTLLDPSETFTFTASRIATSGQYTNLAVATGTPSGGGAAIQDGDLDNHFGVAPAPPLLGNISTRMRVETGDNALIGGFIITGTQNKKVIIRGLGPSINVAGALGDPTLELYGGAGNLLRANDNWEGAPNRQEIIDSTIPPPSSFESAILMSLPANGSSYTAILRGFQDQTGVGLVELYDLDQSVDSRLANISTRGLVQLGDDVMIAGFIVLNGNQRVILRAIGPSLTLNGKLADPTLELRDSNGGLIRANDNWRTGGQEAEIVGTTIPPTDDAESAIVQVLAPGDYTAILRGVNNTTGIAVVEVYALQ